MRTIYIPRACGGCLILDVAWGEEVPPTNALLFTRKGTSLASIRSGVAQVAVRSGKAQIEVRE